MLAEKRCAWPGRGGAAGGGEKGGGERGGGGGGGGGAGCWLYMPEPEKYRPPLQRVKGGDARIQSALPQKAA